MAYVKKISQIALPLVLEQLLQVSMGAVDSYLIASLGVVALSGVSVANTVMTVYQAIFLALGTAISSLVSSDSQNENELILPEIISLTLVVGLVLGALSCLASSHLLLWLGTKPDVADVGGRYLFLVGGSTVLLGLMTSLSAYLRARGHYQLPLRVSFLANICNLVLSALSIYLWHWGLVGVALSTVIARLLAVVILYRQAKPSQPLRWRLSSRSQLARLALPVVLERLCMRGGDVVMISLLAGFGTPALAGNAIGETLTQFNYMPGFAIATAIVMLSASLKHDPSELKQLLKQAYGLMLVSMVVVAVCLVSWRSDLIALFDSQTSVVAVASLVVICSLLGLPVTAATLTLTAMHQGLGNSRLPFHATGLGMWLVRLLGGYMLAYGFGLGIRGLYVATMLDNVFRSFFLCYKLSVLKKTAPNHV